MGLDINDYNTNIKNTWCAGCGNFNIHIALKRALVELKVSPSETFFTFDIGCNGNGADKIEGFRVKGLHGRSVVLACGAHLANRRMTTIAMIGDGGCLHEGIEHLVHGIRSNYNITVLIHNNQNFALTTGQATATTQEGKKMYGLPKGRPENDINIGELVLSLEPSFYARGYSGNPMELKDIIKEGIKHKGFSVIEVMQICPTYNKECNTEWFSTRVKHIKKNTKLEKARMLVKDTKMIYTGILYQNNSILTFYDRLEGRKGKKTELVDEVKSVNIKSILSNFQ
jgi:2-oxoglutarate/2-oxoacid ferredoxin oxidoreductase subunit beta